MIKLYIKKGFNPNSIGRPFQKGYTPWSKTHPESMPRGKKHHTYGKLTNVGEDNPMYGVHRYGKDAANWQGGITSLHFAIRNCSEYKQWRSDVYSRDYWTCQTCDKKGGKIKIEAHHIKPFAQIIKENNVTSLIEAQLCSELWDIDNGVTLCENCHNLAEKEYRNGN